MSVFERPFGWLKRLPWFKTEGVDADELTVDGCFTLPGARLDDLADQPEPDTESS